MSKAKETTTEKLARLVAEAEVAQDIRDEEILIKRAEAKIVNMTKPITSNQLQRRICEELTTKLEEVTSLGLDKKGFFGYGTNVNLVIQIVNTIQFNPHGSYNEALMISGLSKYTVDEIVNAGGQQPRIDLANECVVDGYPANVTVLRELMIMASEELGLSAEISIDSLTDANAKKIYDNSYSYQEQMLKLSLQQMKSA